MWTEYMKMAVTRGSISVCCVNDDGQILTKGPYWSVQEKANGKRC